MKVLNIGDNVLHGHRFNGHGLSRLLRKRGLTADHIVWNKNIDAPHTREIADGWLDRLGALDYYIELNQYFGSNNLFYPFFYELLFHPTFLESDVVHLHLLHNAHFGIEHLPILSRLKPVVWTLHDPWALAGHCIYSLDCDHWKTGCGDCPMLDLTFGLRHDTSALNWEYKRLMFGASDLDLIVASQWMADRVRQSPLFEKAHLHLVPFGIDLDRFKPQEDSRGIRQKLGIPPENVVVAFRASESPFKGLAALKECLDGLASTQPLTLLVFQEKGLMQDLAGRFQVVELGWVEDDSAMQEAYAASDLFLMPSTAEAFGMMAIEAMACGKPVIGTEGTSLTEVLRAEESGCVVVPQGDIPAMRAALERFIADPDLRARVGACSRAVAETNYDQERYINAIIDVYEQAITRKQDDTRARYLVEQQKKTSLTGFRVPLFQTIITPSPIQQQNPSGTQQQFSPGFQQYIPPGYAYRIVSDKEHVLITVLRRVKKLPPVLFIYQKIAKPLVRALKEIFRPPRRS